MHGQLEEVPNKVSWLFRAFIMGLRYDSLVVAYFLAPLLVVILFADTLDLSSVKLLNITIIYAICISSFAFFVSAADIPFYHQFGERFSSTAMEWSESKGFMLKLIFSNFSYWGYIFLWLLGCTLFIVIVMRLKRYFSSKLKNNVSISPGRKVIVYLGLALLFFVSMRGRLSFKSPIQQGTAFISPYMFINELGLNPLYTFYTSLDDDRYARVNFMNDKQALVNARIYLHAKDSGKISPIERQVACQGDPKRYNVVIVVMESMCTFKMGDYGGPNLTPNLDTLIKHSLYFNNFYSSGIHTFNGIYSTLYGYPGMLRWQPLKDLGHVKYDGLSEELKKQGYNTIYFTTHDDQFDNVGGFLRYNGFDRIISQANYPSSEVISVLGVPDHFMFHFSLSELDDLAKKGSPFLCTYMTASDHGPWIIPTNIPFKPTAKNEQDRATQYADWAIGNFLKEASTRPWFNNTIFVFLGDHGLSMGHTYDLSLSYHHIPCIFYAPKLIPEPKTVSNLGGQIDVYPTLMDLLNLPYTNLTMGEDLLKINRPYMYFSDDDKVGCIGHRYYFIHRVDSKESLYEYSKLSKNDSISQKPLVADSMRTYVYSMLQATKWIVDHGKVGENK
jgi:phosphoglycerol transferase MdoB-like AlkP superfamily enzyme